ncbi:sulfite exporter TauE/SafE family protein [Dysosmobacter sp.]|uniref:sulfite exporter TauE/SafE family protein n=1 Tax=Dysosmobacter sp. TaxID=2591382 RepID=UPI002A8CCB7A|nr:TSUP family transporter [Dysosmobacter sp.]MDY3282814.1 TSUP family transporter [Dysosmobacter sp.]
MEHFLTTCLVVCPLVFLAGFVDSVAGGGGLISLPAYLFVGIPAHLAAGTNKVVNGIGTSAAAWRYFRSGKVNLRAAIWAAGGALVGAAIGARLALWCPEDVLKICMVAVLPVVAVLLVVKKDFGKAPAEERRWSAAQEHGLSALIGLVMGMYDGLLGPGTGTFMLMSFTLVLGMDLLTASGCAKVTNLASNVASVVVWILAGKVLWPLVGPALVCNVLGNLAGARYAIRGGSQKVRGMIFVVLGLLFAKMIWEVLV